MSDWIELRDGVGKLWARLEPEAGLLELQANRQRVTFDLERTRAAGRPVQTEFVRIPRDLEQEPRQIW